MARKENIVVWDMGPFGWKGCESRLMRAHMMEDNGGYFFECMTLVVFFFLFVFSFTFVS